jgi:hypothetical protein
MMTAAVNPDHVKGFEDLFNPTTVGWTDLGKQLIWKTYNDFMRESRERGKKQRDALRSVKVMPDVT